jgi:1-deoxy-D-xylulose-5-phosphate synthase
VDQVAFSGGHLASNLGVVEATVALHRVLDTAKDRLVFDVGHQAYVHKLLTGRLDRFHTLRTQDGLSGFPKPSESEHDAFIAGHASTAVSAALGMARARTLTGAKYHVAAFLGDGALTGGLTYEALCDAGQSGEPLLVILNDNGMSIARNGGAIAAHLNKLRLKPQYFRFKKAYQETLANLPGGKTLHAAAHRVKEAIKDVLLPGSFFDAIGFEYLGPTDGHNTAGLTDIFRYALTLQKPVVVHIITTKGKGHMPSEDDPSGYHSVSGDVENGGTPTTVSPTYSDVFGETICQLAKEDSRICAVTAAMRDGTGLAPFFREFPERAFDVGIAEGHAVTMAAGLCKQGLRPVVALYSTFLQRAYDMIHHDVAIPRLPVVFAVDRAGLVGEDGETHQGLYDLGLLSAIPGLTVLAPANSEELQAMLAWALLQEDGPVAIRYPRGSSQLPIANGQWSIDHCQLLRPGSDLTLLTHGSMVPVCIEAADQLMESGLSVEVWQARRLTGGGWEAVLASAEQTGILVVAEEVVLSGSLGQRILSFSAKTGKVPRRFIHCHAGECFVPQGTVEEQRKYLGLDADGLRKAIAEAFLNCEV